MKKIIFTIVATLFLATGVQAQIIKSTTVNVVNVPKEKKVKTFPYYQGEFNIGYLVTPYSGMLETIHGVRINKYLFAGAGVGFQSGLMETMIDNNTYQMSPSFLPIFVNLKGYYPITDKIAPYLSLSLGGNILFGGYFARKQESDNYYHDDDATMSLGGFYCDFGAGIRLNTFVFGVGLTNNGFRVIDYEPGLTTVISRTSFYVKLGFQW